MKKRLLTAVLGLLTVGLCACGKEKPAETETAETVTEAAAEPEL